MTMEMDTPIVERHKYVVWITDTMSASVNIITTEDDSQLEPLNDVCTYEGVCYYHAHNCKSPHGGVVTLFGMESRVIGQIHNVVDVVDNS